MHKADWSLPPFPSDGTKEELGVYWAEYKRWRKDYNTCAECGSPNLILKDHNLLWGDGDFYCENNHYVRMRDSG